MSACFFFSAMSGSVSSLSSSGGGVVVSSQTGVFSHSLTSRAPLGSLSSQSDTSPFGGRPGRRMTRTLAALFVIILIDVDAPTTKVFIEIVRPVARALAIGGAHEAELGQIVGIFLTFCDMHLRRERGFD